MEKVNQMSFTDETQKLVNPKRKVLLMGNAVLLPEEFDDAIVGCAWPLENPWLEGVVAVYDRDKAYDIYFRHAKATLKAKEPWMGRDHITDEIGSQWSPELEFAFRRAGARRPIFIERFGRSMRQQKTDGSV
jgi:hypothetical protein